MSYTNIKHLDELINSKVLFYDLETTGLVKTKGREYKPEKQYFSYVSSSYFRRRYCRKSVFRVIGGYRFTSRYKYYFHKTKCRY